MIINRNIKINPEHLCYRVREKSTHIIVRGTTIDDLIKNVERIYVSLCLPFEPIKLMIELNVARYSDDYIIEDRLVEAKTLLEAYRLALNSNKTATYTKVYPDKKDSLKSRRNVVVPLLGDNVKKFIAGEPVYDFYDKHKDDATVRPDVHKVRLDICRRCPFRHPFPTPFSLKDPEHYFEIQPKLCACQVNQAPIHLLTKLKDTDNLNDGGSHCWIP